MAIGIHSFDFDGCLFNPKYYTRTDKKGYPNKNFKNILGANQALFETIKKESTQYSKSITLVGSNRQSKEIDDTNKVDDIRGYKPSCYPALTEVATALNMDLNRFLLADIYGSNSDGSLGLEPGTSFDAAIDEKKLSDKGHASWIFDDTKATILYAQMHHIAKTHPKEDIVFNFYDDRGNGARQEKDILEWLKDFFEKYPELMPEKVTLRLHHYMGDKVTLLSEIKGKGFVDDNYYETVREMAEIGMNARTGQELYVEMMHSAHHVKPENLKKRKRVEETPAPASSSIQAETPVSVSAVAPIATSPKSANAEAIPSVGFWKNYKFGDGTRALYSKATALASALTTKEDAAKPENVKPYKFGDYTRSFFAAMSSNSTTPTKVVNQLELLEDNPVLQPYCD